MILSGTAASMSMQHLNAVCSCQMIRFDHNLVFDL